MINNKSKYSLMLDSEVTDTYGSNYPDLTTFGINNFSVTTRGTDRKLSYNDCLRFFDVTKEVYGVYNFYDDITLWLNDIEYISDTDTNFERDIKLYSKEDINTWFLKELT